MKKKIICYTGSSDQFVNELKKTLATGLKGKEIDLIRKEFNGEEDIPQVFTDFLNISPDLVFFEIKKLSQKMVNFIAHLKTHSKTNKTFISCIFSDKDSIKKIPNLHTLGIVYSCIKGDDYAQTLLDSIYIAFSDSVTLPKYATASGVKIHTKSTHHARINYITDTDMAVITSVPCKGEEVVPLNVYLFGHSNFSEFKVKACLDKPYRILFHLPYSDQEKPTQGFPSKKFFSNWLANNKKDFQKKEVNVLVLDNRTKHYHQYIDLLDSNNISLTVRNHLDSDFSIVTQEMPHIIIYQVDHLAEGISEEEVAHHYNTLRTFEGLVQRASALAQAPYILVFNSKSNTRAFRKAHRYEKILVHPSSFELDLLEDLAQHFLKVKKEQIGRYYLKDLDKRNIVEFFFDICITSFSEHEITFLSETEFPHFTALTVNMPQPTYIITVPPTKELEKDKGLFHHMAFIVNAEEKDKMEIRQLVNFILSLEQDQLGEFQMKPVAQLRQEMSQKAQAIQEKFKEEARLEEIRKKLNKDEN